MYRLIYLTGAPATGKSTVSRVLSGLVSPLMVFEYGERLTRYLNERGAGTTISQADVREASSRLAKPEHIAAVDSQLLEFVTDNRSSSHLVIDSHAVTKEVYGFRITAFALSDFAKLAPDAIVVLYTPPEVGVRRVVAAAGGRPAITPWEADFHTALQASVAATYGMSLGAPVYMIDASPPVEQVAKEVARLFMIRPESEQL